MYSSEAGVLERESFSPVEIAAGDAVLRRSWAARAVRRESQQINKDGCDWIGDSFGAEVGGGWVFDGGFLRTG